MSRIFSKAHHKLGSMLTVVMESISVVLADVAGPINEEQRRFLSMTERNVETMVKVVSDVFIFQKLITGTMDFNMQEEDIGEVIEEMQRGMVAVAEKKGLVFNVDVNPDNSKAVFDRGLILLAINNILDNAIKFTYKGTITVKAESKDNILQISVTDTGCGLKEEDLNRLFEDDMASRERKYMKEIEIGLGLAVVKEIIMCHKGKIWAESDFGKGSTFHFSIPVK